jgi:predicted RNase H-like nuclease (RuvC/YqgF family)
MAIDGSFGDEHRYKPSVEEQLRDYQRKCENLQRCNDILEEQARYYIKEIFELRAELKYAKVVMSELHGSV